MMKFQSIKQSSIDYWKLFRGPTHLCAPDKKHRAAHRVDDPCEPSDVSFLFYFAVWPYISSASGGMGGMLRDADLSERRVSSEKSNKNPFSIFPLFLMKFHWFSTEFFWTTNERIRWKISISFHWEWPIRRSWVWNFTNETLLTAISAFRCFIEFLSKFLNKLN